MFLLAGIFPIIIVIFQLQRVNAQIPWPCANLDSLEKHECCPAPDIINAGPCGENLSDKRGSCENIQLSDLTFDDSDDADPRKNWPVQFFNRTCVCLRNYGGYDCGECKFGYSGDRCEIKSTLKERKSLQDVDWEIIRNSLIAAKNTPSRYWVITNYTSDRKKLNDSLVNPTVYDLIVWLHYFAARDTNNEEKGFIDYAHKSTGFLTWHRLYLLWLEREIQSIEGQEEFQLFYWDWTNISLVRELFTEDHLGKSDINAIVHGKIFSNWSTVCWTDEPDQYCDPTKPSLEPNDTSILRRLRRCPTLKSEIKTVCEEESRYPTYRDIQNILLLDVYDKPNYDPLVIKSFRNDLEGFEPSNNASACVDDPRCFCGDDLRCECAKTALGCTGRRAPLRQSYHNLVHDVVGRGDVNTDIPENEIGVMSNLLASPNDPAFFAHHTSVDCILDIWLYNHQKDLLYPKPDSAAKQIPEGHKADDYIVPFLPLHTHEEMFATADTLGYDCSLFSELRVTPPDTTTQPSTSDSSSASLQVSLGLFFSLLIATFNID